MIVFEPLWTDVRGKHKGIIHGYVTRGRGKGAKIMAIVQVKDRLVDLPLGEVRIIQAPRRKK